MKKIFLFCAAIVAAMSMSAQTVMTCDDAYNAAKGLAAGDTLTDASGVVQIVEVTAYVTNGGNGTLDAQGQQTFYIGATKDEATKTIQCYKCGLNEGEAAVNKGDKVKVTGKLMRYVNKSGTTDVAELVYATAEVLERITMKTDTIDDLTVCEIIAEGESLNSGTYSQDFFEITSTVDSLTYTSEANMQQTFFFKCDNGKTLQAYNAAMQDGVLAALGDTVRVLGKVTNYLNKQIEFEGPKAWVVGKAEQPKADTIKVDVAGAVAAGKALDKGQTSVDVYIVEGYVDSIAYKFSESSKNMSFYMGDAADATTYDFEAYKVSTEVDIPLGTKVWVVGNLYRYYKEATTDKPEIDLIEISGGKAYLEDPATGIEQLVSDKNVSLKLIENGQMYIIKNGIRYNVLGAQVK